MIVSREQYRLYLSEEINSFRQTVRFSLLTTSFAFIAHYFFLDLELNLEPSWLWKVYRFGIAILCFFGFLNYSYNKKSEKLFLYKLPATLIGLVLCFLQSRTVLWYNQVPYFYGFLFVILIAFVLRFNPAESFVFSIIALLLESINFQSYSVDRPMLISACFVTLFFSVLLSSIKYFQIKIFVTAQNLIDAQRKNIEASIEFTHRIKSFLPRKISRKLDILISERKMTTHQAMDEVIRPQKRYIACLSCDIRNYTQKTKTNKEYILQSVIPLTSSETLIVENHNGVPRKIGDMLLAYYDDGDIVRNIFDSLMTAFEIASLEKQHNLKRSSEDQIKKNILISVGEAIVGNIGGMDSSVEITALGTPVNFLNRLELAVKHEKISGNFDYDEIIVTEELIKVLKMLNLQLDYKTFNLEHFGLKIRNFEEITLFHTIKDSEKNKAELLKLKSLIRNRLDGEAA